ncbi:TIGR04076 family protein [Microbacterium sp. cf046]|uniref:TIGR04076 family protein n=1 Tax=Microbacterium sp. cf046 TaxID=1761803 RepID=UPI0008E0AB16|nr:TIGR04076 family protein [Microbacterium sp. cf046]SFS15479.1 TIGR04076 family protein [Microbacterium sp. cf046]
MNRQPDDSGASPADAAATADGARTELYDLRVIVERIEGRSVCGMKVGDHIDLVESSRLCLPDGGHFCMYALQAVMPLLPAKQRRLPPGDWLERDDLVACPDPDERLIMRIVRTGSRSIATDELT